MNTTRARRGCAFTIAGLSLAFLQACSSTIATPGELTPAERDRTEKQIYTRLKSARLFTVGNPGGTFRESKSNGAWSMGEEFRFMVLTRDASVQFHNLLREATPEGKLYGLLGLKLIGDPGYAAYARECAASDTPVSVIIHCKHFDLWGGPENDRHPEYRERFPSTMGDIARLINAGEIL